MLLGIPRFLWMLLIASGVAAIFVGADVFITTWSDRGVPAQTVTVCRATNLSQHPYEAVNVRIAADGSLPLEVDPGRDVVPPYSYSGTNYPGINWSSQGEAIWYAGCRSAGNSLAVSVTPPAPQGALPEAQATSHPAGPSPWTPALLVVAIRAMSAGVMLIGIVMIGFGLIAASVTSERRFVAVSSDLSTYRRPRIRPHDFRR